MATIGEVQTFLQSFKAKLGVWGVVFRDDRGKNARALLTLEIAPAYPEKVLNELQATDYCEGPKTEKLYRAAEMWVFGKLIKGLPVYIKITLGFLAPR